MHRLHDKKSKENRYDISNISIVSFSHVGIRSKWKFSIDISRKFFGKNEDRDRSAVKFRERYLSNFQMRKSEIGWRRNDHRGSVSVTKSEIDEKRNGIILRVSRSGSFHPDNNLSRLIRLVWSMPLDSRPQPSRVKVRSLITPGGETGCE